MTFDFIKEISQGLSELAKKDKKYKSIVDQLRKILSQTQGEFLSFEQNHLSVIKEITTSHKTTHRNYDKAIAQFNKNYQSIKASLDQLLLNDQVHLQNENKVLEQESNRLLDELKIELEQIETIYKEQNSVALAAKSKETSKIDNEIVQIKKQSAAAIAKIEADYQLKLAQLENDYLTYASVIEQGISDYNQNIAVAREKIVLEKNTYREHSDKKYLSVKNDYHQASTSFNKKVDNLKKKKDDVLHKLHSNYKTDLSPIEEEMAGLQHYFTDLKTQAISDYQQELLNHRQRIDSIVKSYDERKQAIIRENSEAVTLLNSKLSSFRENLQKDRIDETKEFREKLKALESEIEKDQLTKERRRKLRAQDNELNRQIIRTKHDVAQQIREQYIKLAEAENNYLLEKSKWRLDGKLLEYDHKLKTINTELLYQYRQKEIETKIKKRKLKLDHDIELLELKYVEDIAPLEAELSIASAISERDINLLSNDTNFHLYHYGQQEDLISFEQELYILEQNELLDLAKIKREHDRSVLSMTTQLLIEKETVVREQQLKNQNLMRELALLSFEQANLSHELNYLLQKSDKTTTQEYIQKHHESTLQYHDQIKNLKLELHQTFVEFENFKLAYLDHIAQIERDQDILAKDLNVVHSRIHYLFNQIYTIYNIHHHFMLETINLYQLPAHPEDIKTFITLYLDIFKELFSIQTQSIDSFLVDMRTYHERKINDLTGYRFKTSHALLTKNRSEALALIQSEKDDIAQSIKAIENQIVVLQNNVDKVQNQINHVESVLSTETNKKQQKNLRSEIESHQKSINALENEMSSHEKDILKYQKPLDALEQRIKKVDEIFSEKEAALKTEQHEDAKVYFEQMSFYEQLMKRLSYLFTLYGEKIKPLTERLNQPLYLTDDVIKEYTKSYHNHEAYFEKQSQFFYQQLLKGSIKLYDTLNSEQIKLKVRFERQHQKQTNQFNKFKNNLESNQTLIEQRHLKLQQSLDAEEKQVKTQLSSSIQRDKNNLLEDVRGRITQTEQQILQIKERMNHELQLIDANLQSVIHQYELEYEKNVNHTHDLLKKNTFKLKETISARQKSLKQLEESTALKNNVLTNRYEQTEQRINHQLKEKQANYMDSREKKIQLFNKRLTSIDVDLKTTYEKHVLELKQNKEHAEQTVKKLQLIEQKNYQRDLLDSKRSYRFKHRTLKL